MAGWGHLYVTAHGEATGGWLGETAQVGLRVLYRPVLSSNGPIVDVPDNGPVSATYNDYSNTLFNAVETFEATFPGYQGPTTSVLEDLANDFAAWMTTMKPQVASHFRWTHVKVAPIERGTGKYLAPSSIFTLKTPIAGTGANTFPPEVAIACSMRAGIVGKRGRGRIYLPFPSSSTAAAEGRLGSTARTACATGLHTLIKAIEDAPGVDVYKTNVVVMSAANTTAVIPTEVRVGDHFDAQRRRQHQVEENYLIQSL